MKLLFYFITLIVLQSSISAQNFKLTDSIFQEKDVWISHSIKFDFDKPEFRPESYVTLDSLYDFLSNHPKINVEITNHCDERFSDHYSTCLTCKRAKTIEEYLIKKGIAQERLVSKGMNDNTPLIINAKTEEEHALNRRTEVKITSLQ